MRAPSGICVWRVVVLLAFALAGAPLDAQEASPWLLDFRLGGGRALDDLAELRIHEEGVVAGVGVARPLSSRLTLRFDSDVLFLPADTAQGGSPGGATAGSDMRLVHATVGADFRLTPPRWRWGVSTWAGGGFTVWAIDRFTTDTTSNSFQHTYPVVGVGLSVAYAFSPTLSLYLQSRAYSTFAKIEDTGALVPITRPDDDAEQGEALEDDFIERVLDAPLVLGVRWDP